MRQVRETSRASTCQWSRRRNTAASSPTFSQPEIDEESAMPTCASGVASTKMALSATLTTIDTIAV